MKFEGSNKIISETLTKVTLDFVTNEKYNPVSSYSFYLNSNFTMESSGIMRLKLLFSPNYSF